MNKSPVFKRVLAYVVDLVLISILSGFIVVMLPKSEESSIISNKVQETMIEYEKKNLSLEEASEILSNYNYELNYYGFYELVVTTIITFVYFVILPYFWKGKTVGKSLFKLRVVDKEGNNASMNQLVIRSIFNLNIVSNIFIMILLIFGSKSDFSIYYPKINNIYTISVLSCFLFMLYKSNGMGLHDLIAKTFVIDEKKKSSKIKEAEILEK